MRLICFVLLCSALFCCALRCFALHCFALLCIASHCFGVALVCIVLHGVVLLCLLSASSHRFFSKSKEEPLTQSLLRESSPVFLYSVCKRGVHPPLSHHAGAVGGVAPPCLADRAAGVGGPAIELLLLLHAVRGTCYSGFERPLSYYVFLITYYLVPSLDYPLHIYELVGYEWGMVQGLGTGNGL